MQFSSFVLPCVLFLGVTGPAEQRTYEGKTFEEWVQDLRSPDHDKQDDAIFAMRFFGDRTVQAIPDLVKLLDPRDDNRSAAILSVFVDLREKAKPAVPALIRFLPRADHGGAVATQGALGAIGPAAREAIPLLLRTFPSGKTLEIEYRRGMPLTLARIGPQDERVRRSLLYALGDWHRGTRINAGRALWKIGDTKLDFTAIIADGRRSTYRRDRLDLVAFLGEMARSRPGMVSTLVDILKKDKDPFVRGQVINVLEELQLRTEETLSAYQGALRDRDWYVRAGAAQGLGTFGPRAREAVPALLNATRDDDPFVRSNAAHALWRIDANEHKALALRVLGAALRDTNPYARAHAADLLGELGSAARGSLPRLRDASRDSWSEVREAADKAILRISKTQPK
jgi:HEAT repeat protein